MFKHLHLFLSQIHLFLPKATFIAFNKHFISSTETIIIITIWCYINNQSDPLLLTQKGIFCHNYTLVVKYVFFFLFDAAVWITFVERKKAENYKILLLCSTTNLQRFGVTDQIIKMCILGWNYSFKMIKYRMYIKLYFDKYCFI